MKNKLYLVYGGMWDVETNYFKNVNEMKYFTFKNREKAEKCKENLLDGYMKTKSYTPTYTISADYILEDQVIHTTVTDIYNKKGDTVFSVEIKEIDLSNVII